VEREVGPVASPEAPTDRMVVRRRVARVLAISVDALQIVVFPIFFPGVLAPLNNVVDVVTGIAMVLLLGWHVAFLPTFLAELIPFVDLFPSWTLAVLFVTRGRILRS
jgi:hypothetical protein